MLVRLTRPVTLTICNHDPETGEDWTRTQDFAAGGTLLFGEVSPNGDGTSIVELLGLGYAEVPDDCWGEEGGVVLFFRHGGENHYNYN